MKFSLSWLRDHLDYTASLEEICTTLNNIGHEVESVEEPAKKLAGFRTAKILEASKHPDADRLQICRVNAGTGFENIQVVCGAPNARANLHVIFAPPGTYIPGSEITIKAGKIRGEKSEGMLCSLRELGLGEESNGIAELSAVAPIGVNYVDYANLDDPVIDIAITPNRGDALSIQGIARDLAAAGIGSLKPHLIETVEGQGEAAYKWDINHPGCQFVTGRLIRGVKNGPSPEWLQRRLDSVGLTPRSLLVDVTNYVMLTIGQPMHAFDASKLDGSILHVTRVQSGTFRALDGKDYSLISEDMVIADSRGAISLAGIIGGENSAVDENTTDVFLEAAYFNAVQIALTGRRLAVQTDARYRFERGVDPAMVRNALEMATALIMREGGGEAGPVVEAGEEPLSSRKAVMRFERFNSLAGLDMDPVEAVHYLEHLGFEVIERDDEKACFKVPTWRHDIAGAQPLAQAPVLSEEKAQKAALHVHELEAECDLIEEVLRLKGLDHVKPVALPPLSHQKRSASHQGPSSMLRRLCAERGLMETVGFSFVSGEDASFFEEPLAQEKLVNPIASDLDQLRPTALVNLLRTLERNLARGLGQNGEAAFFEIGPAFGRNGTRTLLAAVRGGVTSRYPGQSAQEPDWLQAKSDLMAVLESLNVPEASLSTTADAPSYYHPGRSGQLRQGPKLVLGSFGELHPCLVQAFNLTGRVVIFELDLTKVPAPKIKRKAAPEFSSLQPVRRDFAFLAGPDVVVQDVIKAVRLADRKLISDVRLFDVYEGEKLPKGYRSLGIEVTLQPKEESLTDQQLETLARSIEQAVEKATGATLRR